LFLLTVVAGLAMGAFGEKLANRDVAIGLVLALALGIGLLFLHFFTGFATQATALLFGNILAVSRQTLVMLVVMSVACVLVLAAISRPLLFASLQPELAEAKGVHARRISTVFMVIVAVTTAGASQIVGVLLVFALMVGPAAAAQRLTLGVVSGLVLSAGLALAEAWGGLALAYTTDWPTSFWITSLSVGVYVASLAVPKAVHA
jgi:zinc/manganese transport system permease protein